MYPLKNKHTFGLDAYCSRYIEINSVDQLRETLSTSSHERVFVIGEGSNCVFVDNLDATVIKLNLFGKSVKQHEDYSLVKAYAGENWHAFVQWCLDEKVYGLENLALIPGTVGAAPIQNIGAYGVEIEQFVHQVDYLDMASLRIHSLSRDECEFGYRNSIFKQALKDKVVILSVTLNVPKRWQPVLSYGELKTLKKRDPRAIFNAVIAIRQKKLPDPKKIGNAGSFFKNPIISSEHRNTLLKKYPRMPYYEIDHETSKLPAAWLIENSGFKGVHKNGVQCHSTQALVLTNTGNATGNGLLTFANEIVTKVNQLYGVRLENEVRLMGKNGPVNLSDETD